jgi:hypothetical protein
MKTSSSTIRCHQPDVSRDWRRWIESPAHVLRLSQSINRINPDLILTVNTYPISPSSGCPAATRDSQRSPNTTQQLIES